MPGVDQDEFEWHTAEGGYELLLAQEEGVEDSPFLILSDGSPADRQRMNGKPTHPLADGAFFLDVAWAETPEEYVALANLAGLLNEEREFTLAPATSDQYPTRVYGERLDYWRRESAILKHAVNFRELTREKDVSGLTTYIKKAKSNGDPVLAPMFEMQTGSDGQRSIADIELELLLRKEDDFLFAATFLKTQIASHLEGHINIRPGALEGGARLEPAVNFVPDALLPGVWLQFALAIDADKHFRQCRVCPKWFEYRETGERPSRQYCSNACRLKAYRARRRDLEKK